MTTATFWYLKKLPLYEHTKPYTAFLPLSQIPAGKRTNQDCGSYGGMQVRDIRERKNDINLDENGFEFCDSIPLSLSYDEFRDPVKVSEIYCQNVLKALLNITGATTGKVIHHMIRRRHQSFPDKPRGDADAETDQPIQGVHCDFTPLQAYTYFQEAVGDQATKIWNEQRVEIIQVWRPIRGPVTDWPLGVCDVRTVDKDIDLIATDNVRSYKVSESYNVFHNPNHQWYYIRDQTPEDVLLFKGYDNAKGVSTFCPHAAFEVCGSQSVNVLRESIECAVLLIHPKDRPHALRTGSLD